jgi:tRNA (uracil-5-)-methyltransferase
MRLTETISQLTVTALSPEGDGVVTIKDREVWVPFTAPGDVISVSSVYKRKRQYYAADWMLEQPSKFRVEPVCEHFGEAGGCSLQHLHYDYQLAWKSQKLTELLGQEVKVKASPVTNGYRNRMDVAITDRGIGFRRKGSWSKIVEIDSCVLASDKFTIALKQLREFAAVSGLAPRNPKTGEGFLRYLVFREGKHSGETQITLLTNPGELNFDLSKYFTANSIYWATSDSLADVSEGDAQKFWKQEYLHEELAGVKFAIHPNSFFQSNSYVAAEIAKYVSGMVNSDEVLDLYCGVGTFALALAKQGLKTQGSDSNANAISLAKKNAELNDLQVSFEVIADRDLKSLPKVGSVIVDPPRAGLHADLTKLLLQEKPGQLIYVSCNPNSLQRDLELLRASYTVKSIQGFDMFPHTPHVETVVELNLKR